MKAAGCVLAIETSQRAGSVALRRADGSVAEESIAPAGYGDDLLPAVDRLCRGHGVAPGDLAAVIIDIGPGGFTGLRIGIAAAKLIGETTGAALVGVPAALVAAERLRGEPTLRARALLAILAVKRRASVSSHAGTAWCARLEPEGEAGWSLHAPSEGAHLVSLERIEDGTLPDLRHVDGVLGEAVHLPAVVERCRLLGLEWVEARWSARACLEAGERALAVGRTSSPEALLPIYARDAEAVTLWDARHGGRGEAEGRAERSA